jgi:AbrB family looped-hinge helix DNA binding protein
MHSITVPSKFQIVIPLAVHESRGLAPGAKQQVAQYKDRIELIPQRSARAMRGRR